MTERPAVPVRKIYSDKMIWTGTFLGGPLVAGYLMARNYKAMGRNRAARTSWLIAIAGTVLLFGIFFMLPEDIKIPNYAFPILTALSAYAFVESYQWRGIARHKLSGGPMFTWGRVVWESIVGAVLTLFLFAALLLLSE